MRGLTRISLGGAALLCACGSAMFVAAPVAAQGSYSPYNETPAAALARYVRALAQNAKDFDALIGAGRAALELGDTQAAAGFFARADDVDPRSPYPQEGMGAVSVANGDAKGAMPYFTRALQLGATQASLGCDRGLAYDLLGQQSLAQADYRAALAGSDAGQARRRLALSLAISGDRAGALEALAPLSAKGDATSARVRAFVLALTGDSSDAMAAVDAAMPGSWSRVAPFLQRLPSLPAGERAAAVNLGIFPNSSGSALAYAGPPPAPVGPTNQIASTDNLAGIDALLRGPSANASQPSAAAAAVPAPAQMPIQAQPQPEPQQQARAVEVAYATPPRQAVVQRTDPVPQGVWLQLGSARNAQSLSSQFERLKSNYSDVFKGITAYLAQEANRSLLVIGPFKAASDASIFADDLHSIGVDATRWTNSDSDRIVPLAAE